MHIWKLGKLIIFTDLKFNSLFHKVSVVIDFIIIIVHHFSSLLKLANVMNMKTKRRGKSTVYRFGKTLGYLNVHSVLQSNHKQHK